MIRMMETPAIYWIYPNVALLSTSRGMTLPADPGPILPQFELDFAFTPPSIRDAVADALKGFTARVKLAESGKIFRFRPLLQSRH